MYNDKEYLKNLIIVRRNLQKFLRMYDRSSTPYLYYHTENYLDIINQEIEFIKKRVSEKEKEFAHCLLSIYDFGA